jgi:hypothetical protein
MMLSEYESSTTVRETIDKIMAANNITVERFSQGFGIGAGLELNYDNGREFYLHEFPGNCSSLVISNIQGSLLSTYEPMKSFTFHAIEAVIEIAEKMEYGALFASGTNIRMKEILESMEFKPVAIGVHNPHSGNDNFFMMRVI